MDWLTKMNLVIAYIEEHLEDELNISDIAKIACVSTFHFYRLFDMLTGISVTEYIRRRRLTRAAQELALSDVKVIDIALKYGYDSPEAFSKAFRKLHGLNPSQVRAAGASLILYPPLSFKLYLKGEEPISYRIEKKSCITFIGKTLRNISYSERFRLPLFFDECKSKGTIDKICNLTGTEHVYGVIKDENIQDGTFSYMIAVEKPDDLGLQEGMEEYTVQDATWAVFKACGMESKQIGKLREKIYSEWFLSSGYEHDNASSIEVLPAVSMKSPDFQCEIWIPVIKKADE